MPTALQCRLSLKYERAPALVGVETARFLLADYDVDEDAILRLIDDGVILHAWNIALTVGLIKENVPVRREIRIWPDCLKWFCETNGRGEYKRTEGQVLDELFSRFAVRPARHEEHHIRSTRLRRLLNCGSTHITNLIESKSLAVLPGTSWSTGPNGAALVTLSSIVSFA